jgi:hypothetical protein
VAGYIETEYHLSRSDVRVVDWTEDIKLTSAISAKRITVSSPWRLRLRRPALSWGGTTSASSALQPRFLQAF